MSVAAPLAKYDCGDVCRLTEFVTLLMDSCVQNIQMSGHQLINSQMGVCSPRQKEMSYITQ